MPAHPIPEREDQHQVARPRGPRVTLVCPVCSGSFTRKASHAPKSTYCSRPCMARAYEQLMQSKQNPNWRGGLETDDGHRRAWERQWRQQHPEKVAAWNRRTKAARKGAVGSHTADDIRSLWDRQSGRCAACGTGLHDAPHVDHIIPIKRGGTDFVGNLQLLCPCCNLSKKTLLPIEFRVRVLRMQREDEEQAKVFDWATENATRHPELAMLFHAANGGYRSKQTAVRMQLLGVKKGVPDIALPCKRRGWSGLWIEMKVGRNRPTDEQRAWISALQEQGHRVEVCYGFEAARDVILDYLGPIA